MKAEWRALYLALREEKSRNKMIRQMVKGESHWMIMWLDIQESETTLQGATIPFDEWPLFDDPKDYYDGDSFFSHDEAFCQGGIIRFCEEWRRIKGL